MSRITTPCDMSAANRPSRDDGIPAFLSRLACACAQTTAGADAPLAQALFHRVELLKERPDHAARAMGLEPGDAAYLLAGLRQDTVKNLVLVLGAPAGPLPGPRHEGHSK